jgi:uncharacterized protein YkwD
MKAAALFGNRLVVELLLILLFPSCLFGSQPQTLLAVPSEQRQISQMLGYINQLRTERGLSTLTLSPRLCQAAKQHSEDMAQYHYFGHRGRRRFLFGSSPGSRATANGYQWRAIAENLWAGNRSLPAAFQSWVLSAGHYRNLMDPRYLDVGIGVACTPTRTYWVALFARPWVRLGSPGAGS